MASSHSESKEIQGKVVGGHIKPVSSIGTQDFVFSSSLDYSQAIARISFQYVEPYFGGLLAAPYGPQDMVVTFWEGEIVDTKNYTFLAGKWEATAKSRLMVASL